MYGIPNMKLEKQIVDRRVRLMTDEGIEFKTGIDVGKDISPDELLKTYDAVVLCCGAGNPRDLKAENRDIKGIYFAVDFLKSTTKALLDNKLQSGFISAKDKDVIIVGGGDTGNDCVGTCIRHGCKTVTQLEMMPKLPDSRAVTNPWPQYPRVCKTDYGQEEAIAVFGHDPRVYCTTVKAFVPDDGGNIKAVVTVELKPERDEKTGRTVMTEMPKPYIAEVFGAETDGRSNIATAEGSYKTSVDKLFTAGDCRRGQSLVVWAIAEGRAAAKEIDEYLMGYTNLV